MSLIAIFDTNVLISASVSLMGAPFRCLALAKAGAIESVTCAEILDEFREKLVGKFSLSPASPPPEGWFPGDYPHLAPSAVLGAGEAAGDGGVSTCG